MGGQRAMDIHGVEELTRQFSAFTTNVKASHHLNGQQVITLNGDGTATDVHYCRAALISAGEDGDVVSDNYIRYTDTLVERDGQWLIAHREQHFLMTETRPHHA